MIKQISKSEIPDRNQKYIEINRDLDEFLNSGAEAAIVDVPSGRKPDTVCTAYRNQINRNGYYTIKVILRKDQVFLVRKDI